MPNSTVYDVSIRYGLDDKASAALENLGRTAERTEQHVGGLKEGLRTLAEVFLVKEGLHKAKEMFVDFNSEMEQMKINLAAVSSFNLGKPFAEASVETDKLIAGWQQFSKSTTMTTKQLVEFGTMLEGPVLNATGGNMKVFDEIVKRGAVVGNILGAAHPGGAGYVAREFQEALMGNVRNTQMLNKMLLEPALEKAGKSIKDWNSMTAEDRVKIFQAAINDPAWDAAIARQRDSFLGLTSTLRDNFEILAGQTGEKFFAKVKGGLKEINDWIDKHPKEIADFTTKVADGLAKAFDMMAGAFKFVVDHKDLILKLAEAWAIGKVTGAFGGASGLMNMLPGGRTGGGLSGLAGLGANLNVLGAGTSSAFLGAQMNAFAANGFSTAAMTKGVLIGYGLDQMTGNLGKVNTGMLAFEGALSQLPGPLGLIGTALLAFHAGLKYIADLVDDLHKERANKAGDFGSLRSELLLTKNAQGKFVDHTDAAAAIRRANEMGLFSKTGELDVVKARASFEKLANESEDSSKALKSVPDMVRSLQGALSSMSPEELAKILRLAGTDSKPTDVDSGKKKNNGDMNIHIQKIEVPASDPDRFVHSLVSKFNRAAKNPTAADRVLRGGF